MPCRTDLLRVMSQTVAQSIPNSSELCKTGNAPWPAVLGVEGNGKIAGRSGGGGGQGRLYGRRLGLTSCSRMFDLKCAEGGLCKSTVGNT